MRRTSACGAAAGASGSFVALGAWPFLPHAGHRGSLHGDQPPLDASAVFAPIPCHLQPDKGSRPQFQGTPSCHVTVLVQTSQVIQVLVLKLFPSHQVCTATNHGVLGGVNHGHPGQAGGRSAVSGVWPRS